MHRKHKILYTLPKTLFIPVGTPLMGKTTWIKRVLPQTVASVSRDDIRKAISRTVSLGVGKFYETIVDDHMEEEIEELWWKALKWNMKRGVPVVSDTTNLTYKGRQKLCNLAHAYGYIPLIIVFTTRDKLRACISTDTSIMTKYAKELYKQAIKTQSKAQYHRFIKKLGITSDLGTTLMLRNYERLHKDNIFINPRVLSAMLKRMYNDYPYRAYLKTDFARVKITNIPHPCIDKCLPTKRYKAVAEPPQKPTMEGKEW